MTTKKKKPAPPVATAIQVEMLESALQDDSTATSFPIVGMGASRVGRWGNKAQSGEVEAPMRR